MNRTSTPARQLNWLYNAYQAVIGRGGQIDWSRVTSLSAVAAFTVTLAAAAAKGAVALVTDALPYPVQAGTVLDFGEEESVTVTFSAALVDATSVGVTALTGPIPSGTILKSADAKEFVKLTADAAEGATSLTVEAIPNALEGGETATYQGGRKLAKVTEDAAADDTALTVEPLQFAIADNAEATVDPTGNDDGRFLKSGTIMARTDTDMLIPRRDADDEEATEILVSDASEFSKSAAKTGYGTYIEAQAFENLLPDADDSGDIPSGWKTELADNGARINFSDWSDSRATD